MKVSKSIKKNYQFRYIFKKGKSFNEKNLKIFVVKNKYGNNRIGIAVSKDIKGSVKRNRLKRFVREAWNIQKKDFDYGVDLVIFIKNSNNLKEIKFWDFYNQMEKSFFKINLLKKKKEIK